MEPGKTKAEDLKRPSLNMLHVPGRRSVNMTGGPADETVPDKEP